MCGPRLQTCLNCLTYVIQRFLFRPALRNTSRDSRALDDNHPRFVALEGHNQFHTTPNLARPRIHTHAECYTNAPGFGNLKTQNAIVSAQNDAKHQ